MFSCEFCEISKNTVFYRTPLVAVSVNSSLERADNWYIIVTCEKVKADRYSQNKELLCNILQN